MFIDMYLFCNATSVHC